MVGPSAARAGVMSVVAPTAGANALAVVGVAEPNADIEVTTTGAVSLCTTTADGFGDFTCYFPAPRSEGDEVLVTSTVLGVTSSPVSVFVDDTAPGAPTPDPSNGTFFAGAAEPNSTIRIRSVPGGVELCVTAASPSGTYACTPASPAPSGFEAYAVDPVGNVGPSAAITYDNTPPAPPVLTTNGTQVVGTAEALATVTVVDLTPTTRCSGTAAGDGAFGCALSSPPATIADLSATASDAAGNTSAPASLATDVTPPAAPTLVPDPVATTHVAGTAEVGASLTAEHLGTPLCTLVVGGSGIFDCTWSTPLLDGDVIDLTIADALGNQTTTTATVDGAGPTAPTLVSIDGSGITLTIEAGSTVTVTGWPTSCPPPSPTTTTCTFTGVPTMGTVLTAIATDAAGNPGTPLVHTVDTSSATPTALRSTTSTTTGTAPAGSTVQVHTTSASGTVICTTTADGVTGAFSCTLSPTKAAGTRLYVTATNSFGTTSAAGQVIVAQAGASVGVTLHLTVDPGASTSGPIVLRIQATRDDNVVGTTINPVVVKIDGSNVASRLLSSGATPTAIDVSPLLVGLHDIELSYNGTTTFLPALAFGQVQVQTATAVSGPTINAVAGEAVNLAATVATSPPSATIPTGSVQFLEGATLLGTATLDGSGAASLPGQYFTVGTHWITVSYAGTASLLPSNGTIQVIVTRSTTTVALSASSVTHMESQVVSAQVNVTAPGTGNPSGIVTFTDGATTLGTASVDGSGQASLSVSLPVGSHTLTATYSGDAAYVDAVSASVPITISQAPVLVSATPDPLAATEGTTAALSVHTAPVVPAAGAPAGTVTVYPGLAVAGTPLGSATLDGAGDASVTLTGLISTDTQITVVYDGSPTHAIASGVVAVTVSPPAPTTTTTTSTTTTTTTTTTEPPTTTTEPPTTTTTEPPTTTTTTEPPTTTTEPPTTTTTSTTTTTTEPPTTTTTGATPTTAAPATTTTAAAVPLTTASTTTSWRAPTTTAAVRHTTTTTPRRSSRTYTPTPQSGGATTTTTAPTTTTTLAGQASTRVTFLSPSAGQFPADEPINIRIAVAADDTAAADGTAAGGADDGSATTSDRAGTPTGDVEIRRDDELVCVITLDAAGRGDCADDAPLGEYSLRAQYLGDEDHAPSSVELTGETDASGARRGAIEVVPSVDVQFAFDVELGAEIDGATVQAWGDNLPPDASVVLQVHSTPVEVARFTTDATGSFRESFELPPELEDGNHRVVAILTPPDETESVADYEFAVERHRIVELETAPLGTPVAESAVDAPTRADRFPAFDVAAMAPQVLANQTELFALLALLGTSGSMAAMAFGGGGSTGTARKSESKKRSSAKVSGAGSKVHGFDAEHHAWGDRSVTWRLPGHAWLDGWSRELPHAVSRWSPMLARTLQDGTYLRAAFGTAWAALLPTAVALGVGAGIDADGSYLPPSTGWVVALLLLGIADAGTGLLAGLAYVVTTAVIGGLPTLDGAQATAGLLALWFAPAVIAACTRPLRRIPATTWEGRWERACDAAMAPLWGAWGAQGIAWAQNGLSGRQLPVADQALTIAVVTFVALVARFALETVASNLYPERLVVTECGRFEPTTRVQQLVSLALKVVLFVVVGSAFFPLAWQFWVSAGFFVFSAFAGFDWIRSHMPNAPRIYRWMPGGLLKGILMVLVGRQFGEWLKAWQPDPERQVLDGMILLALPGLALTLLALFSHTGERPPLRWWHRLLGIPLLVVTIGLKVGWF